MIKPNNIASFKPQGSIQETSFPLIKAVTLDIAKIHPQCESQRE